jgi:hypothetical protein
MSEQNLSKVTNTPSTESVFPQENTAVNDSHPQQLEFILERCSNERETILKIRNKILNFDERIREFSDTRIIKYGKIKSEPLAELRLLRGDSKPILILKLPILNKMKLPILNKSSQSGEDTSKMGRMRIETDNWQEVSRILYVPRNNLNKFKKVYQPTDYVKVKSMSISYDDELEMLVDIALEKWREKL